MFVVPSCTLASADVDFMQGLLPFPLTHRVIIFSNLSEVLKKKALELVDI